MTSYLLLKWVSYGLNILLKRNSNKNQVMEILVL